MKRKREKLVQKRSLDGLYGTEVKILAEQLRNNPLGNIEIFLKTINDFYSKEIHPIFRPYPIALINIVLALYFKNNDSDPILSEYPILIFQKDLPNQESTCIHDKYLSMLDATHAYKQSIASNNKLIVWETAKSSFLAYNEFMNALLGTILVNLRFAKGKSYNLNVVKNNYGSKLNELKQLAEGVSYYDKLFEILNPEIRNAIAHQSIWYDENDEVVRYRENKNGVDKQIKLEDFILMNSKASYLGEAYLVIMSVIGIFLKGTVMDRTKLPKELFLYLMEIISNENDTNF
jgi:hypothetical protein